MMDIKIKKILDDYSKDDVKLPLYKLHPKLKKKLLEGNLKRLIKTRRE
jgi:hypothetical protein